MAGTRGPDVTFKVLPIEAYFNQSLGATVLTNWLHSAEKQDPKPETVWEHFRYKGYHLELGICNCN